MPKHKINFKKLQDEMEKRMTKQRRNRANWTANQGYSIKETDKFTIAHGKYIKGE